MRRQPVSVVITDLDNTLYDWFEFWYASFDAMLDELIRLSGVTRDRLIAEAKDVHERHGTSEYAFLIEELPSLQRLHQGEDVAQVYAGAIEAYRRERRERLRLYPGVMETLEELRRRGCLIVAHTDSMGLYSAERIRHLGLDGVIGMLYSKVDHDLPANATSAELRMDAEERYRLRETQHRPTRRGEAKPNPELLLDIINDIGATPDEAVYVGDSLTKDILMAQRAGVADVFARYGPAHTWAPPERYELLRAVTHWTREEVEEERRLRESEITPTFVLEESFAELLALFEFTRHSGAPRVSL